jgi:hypothetical protein
MIGEAMLLAVPAKAIATIRHTFRQVASETGGDDEYRQL